jgi:hypothetical protein
MSAPSWTRHNNGVAGAASVLSASWGQSLYSSLSASSSAISNNSAQTAFSKTATLPAGALSAGAEVVVRFSGKYTNSTGSNDTTAIRVKLDSDTVLFINMTLVNGFTDVGWCGQQSFIARTVGASGTMQIGAGWLGAGGGGGFSVNGEAGTFTHDTTADGTITVTADMTAASASLSITLQTLTVEVRPTVTTVS